jgi:hydrogenase nickel incorporation protein HypB
MTENIPVLKEVTEANTLLADVLRAEFAAHKVLVLNVIASPGAGKTSLLERTIKALDGELRISVIEGDPTTSIDAQRIAAVGTPVVQINTGGGCHLEARQIQKAVEQLDVSAADIVIIENVGNLMCPTEWDLGEDIKVVVASLPEGDDKPLKYPLSFMKAQAVVVNKIDLEPYIPAKAAVMRENALKINPELDVFEISCATGEGIDEWLDWLRSQLASKRSAAA